MPLVARGLGGLIDATRADLGLEASWDSIHRVKPRAMLACDACGERMHAKVSPLGLRFFAHDAARADCPLTGETPDHRLLKSAIAAAVREAGWHATLEAVGPQGRWRADVLATSPDGSRRIAWEAQLAWQHDDDTVARSARYAGDGVDVVWVFDRPAASAVPAIVVEVEQSSIRVTGPLVRLHIERCKPGRCSRYRDLPVSPPCPGHERWEAATMDLEAFVGLVCRDAAVWVRLAAAADIRPDVRIGRPVMWWWTSPDYLQQAEAVRYTQSATDTQVADQRAAMQQVRHAKEQRRRAQELRRVQDDARRAERVAALLERQERLKPAVIQRVTAQFGTPPWHLPADPEHAMGVSIVAAHHAVAVICPVASRITGEVADRLAIVTVYVASEHERQAILHRCRPGQRVVVLTDDASM